MLWTLAEPGGRTRRAPPPLTTAAQWFFYAQNANFSVARFTRDSFLVEIWPKHAKNDFYFNP